MPTPKTIIPYGFCHCGCGQKTSISRSTDRWHGWVRGEPKKYINHHKVDGRGLKHGHSIGGKSSPTLSSWANMIQRCANPNNDKFPRYGAVGIRVCKRWSIFKNFLEDMGERPYGTTIDRFPDKKGNYEPGNCRWATIKEQQQNTKNNRNYEYDGDFLCLSEIARRVGISFNTLSGRLDRGMNIMEAVEVPFNRRMPYGPKRKTIKIG